MTRILLALAIASVSFAQTTPKANAENGKKLFTSYGCYQCHGGEGQGSVAGPRLAPRPIPLVALIAYVRHPSGAMPPYTAKVASDSDFADIRAFLETIKNPPPVQNIPILNQ